MKSFKQMTKRDIEKRSLELFPDSEHKRNSWSRQTQALIKSGRHALITGGFKVSGFNVSMETVL